MSVAGPIADGGTLISLAANQIFEGSVTLTATASVAPGGSSTTLYPSLSVSGAGGNYADGTVLASLALFVPSVAVAATTGMTASGTVTTPKFQLQSGANLIKLILTLGPGVVGTATFIGETFTLK